MRHPADADELLEVLGQKLRPIVADDPRRLLGKFLFRPLKDHQFVLLRHRAANLPMHNVAAVAVEDRREVVKRAVNVEVADVDMPGRNGDITDFHPFGR